MSLCIECGLNPVENKDTGLCATCGHARRKAERDAAKMDLKAIRRKPVKKVSDKRKKENAAYIAEAMLFVRGKRCAVFPEQKANQVHHKKGREGYADDWAREHGVTLLMDKRFWVAVSDDGHRKITDDSAWASANGFSYSQVADGETPILEK